MKNEYRQYSSQPIIQRAYERGHDDAKAGRDKNPFTIREPQLWTAWLMGRADYRHVIREEK